MRAGETLVVDQECNWVDSTPKEGARRRLGPWVAAGLSALLTILLIQAWLAVVRTRSAGKRKTDPPVAAVEPPDTGAKSSQKKQTSTATPAKADKRDAKSPPKPSPPPPVMTQQQAPPVYVPEFPWPPPAASATEVLPRRLLGRDLPLLTFKDVDGLLTSALAANGYVEKSYYAVPLGFALVTRIEQIEIDGRPKTPPARWSANALPLSVFSLAGYLRALFTAEPGYYRLIVLVVTSSPFAQSGERVTRAATLEWLRGGLNTLPEPIGAQPYSPEVACTALVYEFERRAGQDPDAPRVLLPSRLDAHTHLVNSGLWRMLAGS